MSNKTPILQNSTVRGLIVLILLAVIVLTIISAGKCYSQTPTKRITITEIQAKKALQYKADAEYYYLMSATKDTILAQKDTVISKQRKKLFWRGVTVASEAVLIGLITFKALK
jgi:hypothetical protein